jgi:hypothetical protein
LEIYALKKLWLQFKNNHFLNEVYLMNHFNCNDCEYGEYKLLLLLF